MSVKSHDSSASSSETASTTELPPLRTSTLARSRGALSGVLLVVLGVWGAIVPFIGPSFDFGFAPDGRSRAAARGWLDVLPGAVAALGGVALLMSRSRRVTMLGSWLGIAAGAWFVVGPQLVGVLSLGSLGAPDTTNENLRAVTLLGYFYALGAVILLLSAAAFGRLSVVTVRDVHVAERRQAQQAADEQAEQERARAEQERETARARAEQERRDREADRQAHEQTPQSDRESTSRPVTASSAGTDADTDGPDGAAEQTAPAYSQNYPGTVQPGTTPAQPATAPVPHGATQQQPTAAPQQPR